MPRKYSYAQMREMGLCTACGKKNPTPEKSTCPDCAERNRQNRKKNSAYYLKIGYCTRCGQRKAEPNQHMCAECLWKFQERYARSNKQKESERSKKRYIKAKSKGLCSSCKTRKAVIGVYCKRCYIKQARYRESRRDDIRREERVAYGRCYICGEEAMPGKGVCEKCYEVRLRSMAKARKNADNSYFRSLNSAVFAKKEIK